MHLYEIPQLSSPSTFHFQKGGNMLKKYLGMWMMTVMENYKLHALFWQRRKEKVQEILLHYKIHVAMRFAQRKLPNEKEIAGLTPYMWVHVFNPFNYCSACSGRCGWNKV